MREYIICPACGEQNKISEMERHINGRQKYTNGKGESFPVFIYYYCNKCGCSYTHDFYMKGSQSGKVFTIIMCILCLLMAVGVNAAGFLVFPVFVAGIVLVLIDGTAEEWKSRRHRNGFIKVKIGDFDNTTYMCACENEYPDAKNISSGDIARNVLFLLPAPDIKTVTVDYDSSKLNKIRLNNMYELRGEKWRGYAQLADYSVEDNKLYALFKLYKDIEINQLEWYTLDNERIASIICC